MVKGIHNIKKHERFENVISRIRELENFLFEHESHDGSARLPEGESQFENFFYSNTDGHESNGYNFVKTRKI